MFSVRRRLTLVLTVGFAALVAGAGLYATTALGRQATAEFDSALRDKARSLLALTDQEDGQIEFDYQKDAMPEYERGERPDYFQFWLDDGLVLMRSTRLEDDLPLAAAVSDQPVVEDFRLPDGRAGRMVQLRWVPRGPADLGEVADAEPDATGPGPEPRGIILAVARDREHLDQMLADMRLTLLLAGGTTVLLAALLAWRTLARGFRPITSVARQVARLDAGALGSRISEPGAPREVAPVVVQLNALLQRLDAAFERERRFAGNLAHELRTPIAELRSLAAVAARWPEDTASVARFFGDVGDVADRMESVIADLLLLARCHAGVEHAVRSPVDLGELLETAGSRLADEPRGRRLRIAFDVPKGLMVDSDPSKLEIIATNLLSNAMDYTPDGGSIRCRAIVTGGLVHLEVANPAEPLSPEDLQHLADPFWRKDPARSSAVHAGLGLSLVTALADLLRLQVRFVQRDDGTFLVHLGALPASVCRPGEPPAQGARNGRPPAPDSRATPDVQTPTPPRNSETAP